MIGVVLITHDDLGNVLMKVVESISGPVKNIRAITVTRGADPSDTKGQLSVAIEDIDEGDGIIIITDMFGGTPSNIGLSFLEENKVELITGINLPMLIKLASNRDNIYLYELSEMLKNKGRESILLASELLKNDSIN